MKMILNATEIEVSSKAELEALLAQAAATKDVELWIIADDQSSLCALMNAKAAWLMYLKSPEDVGFSSRNLAIPITDETLLPFRLSNGQEDNYPRRWTFEREVVFKMISDFFETGLRPSNLIWNDDSLS